MDAKLRNKRSWPTNESPFCIVEFCIESNDERGFCYEHYDRYVKLRALSATAEVRARRKGATEVHEVDAFMIFERDRWTCGICDLPVLRDTDIPYHPMKATLDHIVPLAQGGSHVESNVQCSHHACNTWKQDFTADELALRARDDEFLSTANSGD